MKKKKVKKKNEKKAWDFGSSRNHLSSFRHYTFNTRSLSVTPSGIKTGLAYMSLAINVAR